MPARYILDRQLAQGGMASLYLGQMLSAGGFSKQVVLKRLRPELGENPDAAALFLREACLSATLEHPAIVRVLDFTTIDGIAYLVMEHVRGGDLRLVLRRARRRSQRFCPAAALYIGRELCAALDYAHSRCQPDGRPLGLIHRDISPTNILLSVDGEVKLTDFGIAQAEEEQASGPRVRGHVGYMSPEQARGEKLDARSDLFSLATVLYEVFTDRRLFVGLVGQRPSEVYAAKVAPPSQLCADLPVELDAVLLQALALDAAERQASAAILYEQLHDIAQRCRLFMDRAGLARHLRELCGPDPSEWATIEERTATGLIASIDAESFAEDGVAEHEEPVSPLQGSGGLVEQARAMTALDETSEPAITLPWPTVPRQRIASAAARGSAHPEQEAPPPCDDTMPPLLGPAQRGAAALPVFSPTLAEPVLAEPVLAPRPHAPAPAQAHAPARSRSGRHFVDALDPDAVTGPAERTVPSAKLTLHSATPPSSAMPPSPPAAVIPAMPPMPTPMSSLPPISNVPTLGEVTAKSGPHVARPEALASTAQHVSLQPAAAAPRVPRASIAATLGSWLRRERLIGLASGVILGVLLCLLLWTLLGFSYDGLLEIRR
jgi:serine/threonine protein kinase